MGPAQRILIGLMALALATGGFVAGRILLRPEREVVQPIAFNHAKHVELMDCDMCHEHYATSAHSGLPSLSTCLGCHEEAQTESPEEEKIRTLAADGQDDVFRKLFRLEDHVFYTHRRHVTLAGLSCETCHGEVASSESPPPVPLIRVDMDFCVRCHESEGASTACTACHR